MVEGGYGREIPGLGPGAEMYNPVGVDGEYG